MKTRLLQTLLGLVCLLNSVKSDCDLTGKQPDVEFPNIMKYVAESYIMGVEYSIPLSTQTDYYTEYYDDSLTRGRLDSHISGENKKYIYRTETLEAWTLEDRKCKLQNISETADFFEDAQTDWLHYTNGELTTIGPSAMFKVAYDAWKKPGKDRRMAYMGSVKDIRGEEANFWRRCTDGDNYVDYFFADKKAENPYDTDAFGKVVTPLRVAFYGVSKSSMKQLSQQFYDIISFQHYIPFGVYPFELPKGRNCQRGDLVDGPVLPDFSKSNMFLSAEVVYSKYDTKDGAYVLMSSYYSTLMFALDREINHLAYYYSSWNTSKPDADHKEPFLNIPNFVVFDIARSIEYKINYANAKCDILRDKKFSPSFKLPEKSGNLSLTDPFILLPNKKLSYLSSGANRGLGVNIFEAEINDYILDAETYIKRAIVSHSYFQSNEVLENNVEIKNALAQIELRLYRSEDGSKEDPTEEVISLNIFGFTTRLPGKQMIFDVTRCFKNDDDYSFLTIGFEVPPAYLTQVEKQLPQVEDRALREVTIKSELNAMRIPITKSEMKRNYVYVTMLVLDRPPLDLDFDVQEKDKTITVSSAEDTQGVSNFKTCATNCLETKTGCWGFSLCGGTCYFGSKENKKVEEKAGCTLYRRHESESFISTKDNQIENIIRQIEAEEFRIMVLLESGERIELEAVLSQVSDPGEDDSLFDKMGNMLNPRMKVLKAAKKLKKGSEAKNLGKLRYDECQSLCLDFKDCETISYCLINGKCVLSNKYGSELKDEDMETDELCNVLTRKYTDHFERTPGVTVKVSGGTEKDFTTVEDCARACLKENAFKCLSFDHCAGMDKKGCTLYTSHYLNPKSRQDVQEKSPRCGHYTRKISNDFKRKDETRIVGSKVQPLLNLTLEECAKSCVEYGQGTCYGYDFCQDTTLYATSCILFNTDPSRLKSTYSPICTNYLRTQAEYAPRPYTTAYVGGIGFLCFFIGIVLGAVVVFVIAYIRVNKQ